MIDLSLFEGHTPPPWVWNDDWCSALIGLPDKEDADIYDDDAQTVIGVDTKRTPICNSFYLDEHGDRYEPLPEEQLRDNAIRSEDANLIACAPLLLEEVKELRAWKKFVSAIVQQHSGSDLREMLKEMIE